MYKQSARSDALMLKLRKRGGMWLKKLRQDRGLTQAEVAEALGFRFYTFISQIELGQARIPFEALEAYADLMGVPHEEFAREYTRYYMPHLYKMLFGPINKRKE